MRKVALLSMVLLFSVILSSLSLMSEARYPCACFGESCDEEPKEVCLFGETRVCGKRVCAKGPGERCGGPMDYLGRCSEEGLICSTQEERCHGCYSVGTFTDCYPKFFKL